MLSDSKELSEREWQEFLNYLIGGKVKARKQNTKTGESGPWFYLYWEGDCDKYQFFSFPSSSEEKAFESYCEELGKSNGE